MSEFRFSDGWGATLKVADHSDSTAKVVYVMGEGGKTAGCLVTGETDRSRVACAIWPEFYEKLIDKDREIAVLKGELRAARADTKERS